MEANTSTTYLNPEAHEFIPDVHPSSLSMSDIDPLYSDFMSLDWPGHDFNQPIDHSSQGAFAGMLGTDVEQLQR
jgi:hypothetical protein